MVVVLPFKVAVEEEEEAEVALLVVVVVLAGLTAAEDGWRWSEEATAAALEALRVLAGISDWSSVEKAGCRER